jgi:hypothetical protein
MLQGHFRHDREDRGTDAGKAGLDFQGPVEMSDKGIESGR